MNLGNQGLNAVDNMESFAIEYFQKMQEIAEENNQMSEEEKQKYLQRILQKLKNGDKLTGEELSFVQRYYPETYPRVMRIQAQRQQLESSLKHAKSKEEAASIYQETMSSIGKEDPDRAALQSAYSKVYAEFKKSQEYQMLPEKEGEGKESRVFEYREIDEVEKEKWLVLKPEFDVSG